MNLGRFFVPGRNRASESSEAARLGRPDYPRGDILLHAALCSFVLANPFLSMGANCADC
jgi:hypothetical protein